MKIEISNNPQEVVATLISAAVERGGHIALSGGSTPRAAYERAVQLHPDWSSATVWFVDERCVAPDDERSNFRLVKESIIDQLDTKFQPRVFRMRGELGASAGARGYALELQAELGERPRFDLMILGLGPDGHVASLFPNRPEVDEQAATVVAVPEAGFEPFVPRISLTLPVINNSAEAVFLIRGEGKSAAVAEVFGGRDHTQAAGNYSDNDSSPRSTATPLLPAARVNLTAGELLVVLDHDAAKDL